MQIPKLHYCGKKNVASKLEQEHLFDVANDWFVHIYLVLNVSDFRYLGIRQNLGDQIHEPLRPHLIDRTCIGCESEFLHPHKCCVIDHSS